MPAPHNYIVKRCRKHSRKGMAWKASFAAQNLSRAVSDMRNVGLLSTGAPQTGRIHENRAIFVDIISLMVYNRLGRSGKVC